MISVQLNKRSWKLNATDRGKRWCVDFEFGRVCAESKEDAESKALLMILVQGLPFRKAIADEFPTAKVGLE